MTNRIAWLNWIDFLLHVICSLISYGPISKYLFGQDHLTDQLNEK